MVRDNCMRVYDKQHVWRVEWSYARLTVLTMGLIDWQQGAADHQRTTAAPLVTHVITGRMGPRTACLRLPNSGGVSTTATAQHNSSHPTQSHALYVSPHVCETPASPSTIQRACFIAPQPANL